MERWDKLQRRLEAVQTRRQARFLEMQRRSDAQELTRARLLATAAALALSKDRDDRSRDTDGLSCSSIHSVGVNLPTAEALPNSSLGSKMVKFKSQVIVHSTDVSTIAGTVDDRKTPTGPNEGTVSIITTITGSGSVKQKDKAASTLSTGISLPSTSYSRSRQHMNSNGIIPSDIMVSKPGVNGNSSHPILTGLIISESKVISSTMRGNRKRGSQSNIPLLSRSPGGSCKPPSTSFLSLGIIGQSILSPAVQLDNVIGGSCQIGAEPIVTLKRIPSGDTNQSRVTLSLSTNQLSVDTTSEDRDHGHGHGHGEIGVLDRNTRIRRSPRSMKISSSSLPIVATTATVMSAANDVILINDIDNVVHTDGYDQTTNSSSPAEKDYKEKGAVEGSLASKKKKKRYKKKDSKEDKDEEMALLDALLSAQKKLHSLDGDTGLKCEQDKLSSEVSIPHVNIINGTYSLETKSGISDTVQPLVRRPQLIKHIQSFLKAMKRKRSVKTARDQAVGVWSICYDGNTPEAERIEIALSHIYSLYLPTAKRRDVSNKTEIEGKTIDLSASGDISIHSLMTVLCGDPDSFSTALISSATATAASSNTVIATNEMIKEKKLILVSAVCEVLSKLEGSVGDQRKQTGLFIKHGGISLLRVLFGTEVGLLTAGEGSRICGVDEVAGSALLMHVSKAICACSTTVSARCSFFSTGLALLLSDLIGGVAGHLTDWLFSPWSNSINYSDSFAGNNRNNRGQDVDKCPTWPEECQVLPLLLNTLTRLLKHASNITPIACSTMSESGTRIQKENNDQMDGWVRYLFASGCISAICKTIKALQPFVPTMSKEALPHLLICSLLDVIGGVSGCIRSCHDRQIACGPGASLVKSDGLDNQLNTLCTLSLSSSVLCDTTEVDTYPVASQPDTSTLLPITTVKTITSKITTDQKPQHVLKQKDMVSMIKDLQLIPALAQMFCRYVCTPSFFSSAYRTLP